MAKIRDSQSTPLALPLESWIEFEGCCFSPFFFFFKQALFAAFATISLSALLFHRVSSKFRARVSVYVARHTIANGKINAVYHWQ